MERRTEARNPRARGLSSMSTREILELLNDEDATVPAAVRRALPEIERAVELVVASLAKGGHLFYVGAGTSGRLGVLDASEMPPTFGVDPEMVTGIIAGGDHALRMSIEGAEDKPLGIRDLSPRFRPGSRSTSAGQPRVKSESSAGSGTGRRAVQSGGSIACN